MDYLWTACCILDSGQCVAVTVVVYVLQCFRAKICSLTQWYFHRLSRWVTSCSRLTQITVGPCGFLWPAACLDRWLHTLGPNVQYWYFWAFCSFGWLDKMTWWFIQSITKGKYICDRDKMNLFEFVTSLIKWESKINHPKKLNIP